MVRESSRQNWRDVINWLLNDSTSRHWMVAGCDIIGLAVNDTLVSELALRID